MHKLKNIIQIVRKYISAVCNYVRIDGLLHILSIAVIALSLFSFLPYFASIAISAAVAIAKELVYDLWLKKGTAEWRDIICDFVGILYASTIFFIELL